MGVEHQDEAVVVTRNGIRLVVLRVPRGNRTLDRGRRLILALHLRQYFGVGALNENIFGGFHVEGAANALI